LSEEAESQILYQNMQLQRVNWKLKEVRLTIRTYSFRGWTGSWL